MAKQRGTSGTDPTAPGGLWVRVAVPTTETDDLRLRRLVPAHPDDRLSEHFIRFVADAREVLVLSSFILAHRRLEAAVKDASDRGVRVYILTASEKRLERDPGGEVEATRLQEHRQLLDDIAGRVLLRSAPGFHAKVLLRDPHTRPAGLLSTANLVHSDTTWNEEAALELTKGEVARCFEVLRWAFWESAEHELLGPGMLRAVSPIGEVPWTQPRRPVLATTRHGAGIEDAFLDLIAAHDRVTVSNFGFAHDHPVLGGLRTAARAGKEVTVLARVAERTKRSSRALLELLTAGARVVGTDRMHAKLASFDDGEAALIHTTNFTHSGDRSNLELGIVLGRDRAAEVDRLLRSWEATAPWTLHVQVPELHNAMRVVHVADGTWREEKLNGNSSSATRPGKRPSDRTAP